MNKSQGLDRDLILRTARSWIGTRFHFAGRVRKNLANAGGVDCIGLVVRVGGEIGALSNGENIESYDYLTYSRYPNVGEMKKFLDKHLLAIGRGDADIGDLIYLNFANGLEHIALISDLGIIHCYLEVKSVVEHRLDGYWREKIVGFYRYGRN
jgi:cell wall-associated NlpC family hydrolase